MLTRFLPIEKRLDELDEQIEQLQREVLNGSSRGRRSQLQASLRAHEEERQRLLEENFRDLSPWQKVQLARHPRRPYMLDYVDLMCTRFQELHGDRRFGDDPAIVAGLAVIEGRSVVIVGHQKGRTVEERQFRNFGSARPEGYRKAVRVMSLAEKYRKPVVVLIDTPAAACLAEAEERGISEAIAVSQMEMALLTVPVIAIVIGEGGSGGAIGIAVGNKVMMLEHAIYSVIPPEGCAAIIWRDAARGPEAAAALKLTAQEALRRGVIDEIIPEPLGGAHRDLATVASSVKHAILTALAEYEEMAPEDVLRQRYDRFRRLGEVRDGKRPKSPVDSPAAGSGDGSQ